MCNTLIYTFIVIIPLAKPSDLIILTLTGVGVNILDFWWERAEIKKKTEIMELQVEKEGKNQSQSVHYLTSLFAQKISSSGRTSVLKCRPL